MRCPHCHREQENELSTVCQFCQKSMQSESSKATLSHSSRRMAEIEMGEARAQAQEGNTEACYRLGVFYYRGYGCSRDLDLAAESFARAAQQGHADAQYALALCQLQGKGVRQDPTLAMQNLAAAARQGQDKAIQLIRDIRASQQKQNDTSIALLAADEDLPPDQKIEMVSYLSQDAANTCRLDQYELTRRQGFLAYYSFEPLQKEGYLRLPLLHCSHCKTWYVPRATLDKLAETDHGLAGMDIMNFPGQARHPELVKAHEPMMPQKTPQKGKPQRTRRRSTRRGPANRQHLAIKVASCDGGQKDGSFGFRDLCSDAHYKEHKKHRDVTWCASSKNHCRSWTSDQLQQGAYPCLECHLLADWRLGSPADGDNDTSGHRISGKRLGSLAFVTTLRPGQPEKKRQIFAIFQISDPGDLKDGEIAAHPDHRLELHVDEPVYFWDHYPILEDSSAPKWGSVFYRNLEHVQVLSIMEQVTNVIEDPSRRKIAKTMQEALQSAENGL